MSILVILS